MMYLIAALAPWLLLTAAFAALAGWAVAAERAAPAQIAQRRDRDKLVRDLAQLAAGEATPQTAIVNDADTARSLAAIRDGRIAELERALDLARSRAAELAGEAAEMQRRLERTDVDASELGRLRGLTETHQSQAVQTIEAHSEPVYEEAPALQTWRLRYFEQRVKFLEGRAMPSAPALAALVDGPAEPQPSLEWRAREAEARAQFLEQELRAGAEPTPESPFAANADIDTLLRWRMLYLERRVAHLQEVAAHPQTLADGALAPEPGLSRSPDPDSWKWRARYLESRVRHLEQRAAASPAELPQTNGAAVVDQPQQIEAAPPPLVPEGSEERPSALPAAQSGAPDDFTLIEGVSPLQQSTLYSLGIYHFDQIAAWTPANVAWVDKYLRLRGRITEEEWVEQAQKLAREAPQVAPHDPLAFPA